MSDEVIEAAVPSPELVAALLATDPGALEHDQQLAVVGAWERVISWATALQAQALVALDRSFDAKQFGWHAADAARSLGDQLGLVLGVSGGSAQHRLGVASRLVEKVPAVHEALRVGAITTVHARVAACGAAVLDTATAQAVAAAVMADDSWRTPSQFADVFARIVLELDPEGAEDRNRQARRDRRVSQRTEPDGMGSLWALLPGEDAQAVYQRLDAHARSSLATNTAGDDRTLGQRRADALVDLVCAGSGDTDRLDRLDPLAPPPDGPGPGAGTDDGDAREPVRTRPPASAQGRGPRINVVVSWSTLIGLDNAPAYLAGYGHIDAATARRICADPTATWHRLLTDPVSGRLLDYGRTVYRPPQDLRDFVTVRDRTCRFPTCDRAAMTCDIDHREDWDAGGTTCAACNDCLCRRHHRLKHEGGWTHARDPVTGESTWTDPDGRTWTKPATVLPTPEPVTPPTAATATETATATATETATSAAPDRPATPDDPPF